MKRNEAQTAHAVRKAVYTTLGGVSSPPLFRSTARKLLIREPGELSEVLSTAYRRMFHQNNNGGHRIVVDLLALRKTFEENPGLTREEKVALVIEKFPDK